MLIKLLVLVLALGMDTLVMSVSLGTGEPDRATRRRLAITFAAAEGLMPLVGIILGRALGGLIGHWTSLIGAVALLAVGAWMVFFDDDDDDDDVAGDAGDDDNDDDARGQRKLRPTTGWPLALLAISISLDELAVGFSMGLVGIPVWLTVIVIALQAVAFTYLGLSAGRRLKPFLGEWAEKAAGLVLAGLGVWVLVQFFFVG